MAETATIEPWVARARMGVICLGFAWPAAAVLLSVLSGGSDALGRALIGTAVMFAMFVPAAFVFSIVVPTIKARLLAAPLFLALYLPWLSGGSAVNHPSGLPMLLWLLTFTAISMLFPQVRTVRRFYARLFLKQ